MFRYSDIFQMAGQTFATTLLSRDGATVKLNANSQVFKIYRDHFGAIPVDVTGNSPQPKHRSGGRRTTRSQRRQRHFPVDVVAA